MIRVNKYTDRKDLLLKLAIKALDELNEHGMIRLFYDDAECDLHCLAQDIQIEFNIEESEYSKLLDCACGGGAYYGSTEFNTKEYDIHVYCAKCLKRTGGYGGKYAAKEQWDKIAKAI